MSRTMIEIYDGSYKEAEVEVTGDTEHALQPS